MTPELLPDGRLDIARTSWGDYRSRPAAPRTAVLRGHVGHVLGVLPNGTLVCDQCEQEVPVMDRHSMGDDCTEEDGAHFDSLERESVSNEAAEQLRRLFRRHLIPESHGIVMPALDDALRTERRNERRMVVEQIRERIKLYVGGGMTYPVAIGIAIEEALRDEIGGAR